MVAIQGEHTKGTRIPVLKSDGIEDYMSIDTPVKAESDEKDDFYNTKLTLPDGEEVHAASIDLDFFENIVIGEEAREKLAFLLSTEDEEPFYKKGERIAGFFEDEGNTIMMFDNTTNECWTRQLTFEPQVKTEAEQIAFSWCKGEVDWEDIKHHGIMVA